MPLEVRELIIRALVDPSKGKGNSSANVNGASNEDSLDFQKSLLDQLNNMLKKKKER